jgi:hypothetical protein
VVVIKTFYDNIGVPSKLHVLSGSYGHNSAIKKKIATLQEVYEGWRSIRGDGNCYYRAAIYGLIEQIIRSRKREKFLILREKFLESRRQRAIRGGGDVDATLATAASGISGEMSNGSGTDKKSNARKYSNVLKDKSVAESFENLCEMLQLAASKKIQ